MLGICSLLNIGMVLVIYLGHNIQHFGNTLVFGGNLLVLAAMLGWMLAGIGRPVYD
jgi:hypothetical protein